MKYRRKQMAKINKVAKILEDSGAYKEGHFVLTSGRHSLQYVDKFMFLSHPKFVVEIIKMMKKRIKKSLIDYDVIVGPTQGGSILAYELARQTGRKYFIAERTEHGRVIKRGGEISEVTKFLIIDDIYTTGKSINETIAAVEEYGGDVSTIFVVIDRSNKGFRDKLEGGCLYTYKSRRPLFITVPSGIEYNRADMYWLYGMDLDDYDEKDCPVCGEK